VRLTSLRQFREPLDALRRWDDSPGPMGLRQRWLRVWAPHALLRQQMAAVAAERRALLASAPEASLEKGASVDAAARHGNQWGLVSGDGIFWRACVQQSS
jgi:hypothetical protein